MVFDSKEDECSIEILKVLLKGKNKYIKIYSALSFYFTTYQKAINFLIENKLLDRKELGYKNVDYSINSKGKKFLELNIEIKSMIE